MCFKDEKSKEKLRNILDSLRELVIECLIGFGTFFVGIAIIVLFKLY